MSEQAPQEPIATRPTVPDAVPGGQAPPRPPDEAERLAELHSMGVLDSGPNPDLDALVDMAALVAGSRIALITLVDDDEQVFKAAYGLDGTGTPRDVSFCGHAIASGPDPMIINDSRGDPRFADNPLVTGDPHVVFYAGIPLVTGAGHAIGTLCVIDDTPRDLEPRQLEALERLATQATGLIELARRHRHARTAIDPHTGLSAGNAQSAGVERVDAAQTAHAGAAPRNPPPPADSGRARTIRVGLPDAVDANQLVVHYQPIVRLSGAEWIGAEALVRWNHPVLGLVMPDEFIPLAEDMGLIGAIDQHVLRVALHDMAAGRVPGHEVAVNVSPADLVPGFPDVVAAELWDSGVAPASLVVEVTERLRVDQQPEAIQVLNELVDLGVRVAVDDFGAGATSLAHLRQMPVSRLKLDRALVADLDGPDARRAALVVRALAQLSSDLGVEVLGEGVETPAQAEMLISEGVVLGQGFLFGRPAALPDA